MSGVFKRKFWAMVSGVLTTAQSIKAAAATFTGTLTGVAATFTGALSAASASISGALSAGSVSAPTVAATDGDGIDIKDDGGNVGVAVNDGGSVNLPSQPAVLVKPASTQTNLAAGSEVTIVFGTEVYDIDSNFASNTFTAPVGGIYCVGVLLWLLNLDTASSEIQVRIVTSNRTYYYSISPDRFAADVPYWTVSVSLDVDMDASDTLYIGYYQTGGTNQTDISSNSYLSVRLAA